MSAELALRLIGMVICTIIGARVGLTIAIPPIGVQTYTLIFGLIGALVGLILTPYVTTRPARSASRVITTLPAETVVTAVIGLIFGLVIGSLASVPLSLLPEPLDSWMPTVVSLVAAYLSVILFGYRAREIVQVARQIFRGDGTRRTGELPRILSADSRPILMDTSVIIDGRILDISKTGFLPGRIIVPGFVLRQLQHIADESDQGRRVRGRRGLTILESLQKESKVPVEMSDIDTDQARAVDDKLVVLSKQMGALLLTTDLNLNRTATLQGVDVLNINDLATAVRAVMLPGDVMPLKITAEGKEPGQGVGYLDDGTMVVVEDSRKHVDRTIYVKIIRMIQTSAGKMYFAQPEDNPRRT